MVKKREINLKVVILSFIALGLLLLTYFVNWVFIIGAVIIFWLNQKELIKK